MWYAMPCSTLPETNIAHENPPFWWYLPGNMGIFMGYVSFREGNSGSFLLPLKLDYLPKRASHRTHKTMTTLASWCHKQVVPKGKREKENVIWVICSWNFFGFLEHQKQPKTAKNNNPHGFCFFQRFPFMRGKSHGAPSTFEWLVFRGWVVQLRTRPNPGLKAHGEP